MDRFSSKSGTLPGLDGIRGFACILVLIQHSFSSAHFFNLISSKNGLLGVWLFFTLSGFLLARHYLPGNISVRYWLLFLLQRFCRVYLPFVLAVLLYWYTGLNHMDWNHVLLHCELLPDGIHNDGVVLAFWTIPVSTC